MQIKNNELYLIFNRLNCSNKNFNSIITEKIINYFGIYLFTKIFY